MTPLKPLFILLALSPALAADPGFGWKLDRGYKYLWINNGEKVGVTVFRFSRKEGAAGAPEYYQLASRRKMADPRFYFLFPARGTYQLPSFDWRLNLGVLTGFIYRPHLAVA